MAKIPTGSNRPAPPVMPPDSYDAWCYGVVECGTQDGEWEGVPNQARKIMFFFEVPEIPITYEKDGVEVTAPQSIKIEYTYSGGKKAKLKPIIEAWTGKTVGDIDPFIDLINLPARISVANKVSKKGSTYAQITAITKCKQKDIDSLPAMHNKPMVFSIEDHGFESDEFVKLHDWIKEYIGKSHEYVEFEINKASKKMAGVKSALPPADRNGIEPDLPPFDDDDIPN